jgi:hypothetical protein
VLHPTQLPVNEPDDPTGKVLRYDTCADCGVSFGQAVPERVCSICALFPAAAEPVADVSVTPARTLRATARYLARYGWVQGCHYDASATVFTPAACLVGALGMVCYGGPVDTPARNYEDPGWQDFDEALSYLNDHLSSRWYATDAYLFNDAKGRTRTEVLDVLYEAAGAWDWAQQDPQVLYPLELICGCPLVVVFDQGHPDGCQFAGCGGAA